MTTTTTELRTLPYPAVEEEEADVEVQVKFVAYGDLDPNDDIDFEVIPDVRIAIVYKRELQDWWNMVGGDKLGIEGTILPGMQVYSSAEKIANVPMASAITDPDGTIEANVIRYNDFIFCATSPVNNDLIAGCSRSERIARDSTIYVYFSGNRAYFDNEKDGLDRYRQFLTSQMRSGGASYDVGTATFVSIVYPDWRDPYLITRVEVAIIKDSHIGTWWRAISDDNRYSLNVDVPTYAYRISLDTEILGRVPINIARTGDDGIAKVSLEPGDYLFCGIRGGSIMGCDYEEIIPLDEYTFRIAFVEEGPSSIEKLAKDDGKRLLHDILSWEIIGRGDFG